MGIHYPQYPVDTADGDDHSIGPQKGKESLLATLDGTQSTRRLVTDANRRLKIAVSSWVPNGTPVNVFSEVDAPFATETTILTYTVPASNTLAIVGAFGWGDYNGEFLIRVDGVLRGGGRTSAADLNFDPDYEAAPIFATGGQVVTVTITHYNPAIRHFRANLLGGLA